MHNRIVLTHDRATMPDFAYDRIIVGQQMPGVFVLNDRMPIQQAIDELLLIDECNDVIPADRTSPEAYTRPT